MGNNIPLALLGDLYAPFEDRVDDRCKQVCRGQRPGPGPLVLGTIADKRGFETAGAFAVAVSWLATLVLWYVFRKTAGKYAAD